MELCLNDNLQKVKEWVDQWLITFNPNITMLMLISYTKWKHPNLFFDNNQLGEANTHKDLGLTLSNTLSWSEHIHNLVQSVSKNTDVIFKLKYSLDRKTLETMYTSFIRPKLEYSSIVWSDCFDKERIKLENCQLRVARIVTGAMKGASHANIYAETSWPKLEERRNISKFMFLHYLTELLPNTVNLNSSYLGERKIYIIHAQLRIEYSNLNDHLYKLHVINSPNCTHCNEKETTLHYFFPCPLYHKERCKMLSKIRIKIKLCLHILLYGSEKLTLCENEFLFSAVLTFISDSERFVS